MIKRLIIDDCDPIISYVTSCTVGETWFNMSKFTQTTIKPIGKVPMSKEMTIVINSRKDKKYFFHT